MDNDPVTDATAQAATPEILHTERTHRVSVQTESGPALSRSAMLVRGPAQETDAKAAPAAVSVTRGLPGSKSQAEGEGRTRSRAAAQLKLRAQAPADPGRWTPSLPDEAGRARAAKAEAALQDRLASLRGALDKTVGQVEQLENMLKGVSTSKEPS